MLKTLAILVAVGFSAVFAGTEVVGKTPLEACNKCAEEAKCLYKGRTTDLQYIMDCDCTTPAGGDGLACIKSSTPDVNECLTASICDSETSTCRNYDGGYECVCKAGFQHPVSNGKTDLTKCVDIQECNNPSSCPANSRCINSVGSFACICNAGYTKSGNGLYCLDVDECATITPTPCDQTTSTCISFDGGYRCDCLSGFTHVGNNTLQCVDVNECADPKLNSCPISSQCVNSRGSYACVCNDGYVSTADKKFCVDKNECAAAIDPCDTDRSACRNLNGGYECSCKTGYKHFDNNNKVCTDVDECSDDNLNECSKFSYCNNTIGSYNCTCFYGFYGDGKTCTENSPKFSDLQATLDNMSHTQLIFKINHAYYELIHLEALLEKIKRLCPLKNAGLLDHLMPSRDKRQVEDNAELPHDLNFFTTGTDNQLKLNLLALLHRDSELTLQTTMLQSACHLEDVDVENFDVSSVIG